MLITPYQKSKDKLTADAILNRPPDGGGYKRSAPLKNHYSWPILKPTFNSQPSAAQPPAHYYSTATL